MKKTPIRYHVFYLWRLLATGFSFLLFGLGGAFLSVTLFLAIYLAPIGATKKRHYTRNAISLSFKIYVRLLRFLGLLAFEVHGMEHLNGHNHLIIANHPSLLDVVFLISFIRQANCVVKKGLLRNPFTRGPIKAANYINNESPDFIDLSVRTLQQENSLIIFPEGTRSIPNKPLKFLRGAANIALRAKREIIPVIIQCEPRNLLKDKRWYQIPPYPPQYIFRIYPAIHVTPFLNSKEPQSAQSRKLTTHLEQFFTKCLEQSPDAEISDIVSTDKI